MKKLIYELRLAIMTVVLHLALKICPKDATRTLQWFASIPIDE